MLALGFLVAGRAEAVTIDLGDVVAGGNGLGVPLPGNAGKTGIDPETGKLVTGINFGHVYENGFRSVPGTTLVNGVFILKGESQATVINSAGVTYAPLSGDGEGAAFDGITKNREPGNPGPIVLGGKTYSAGVGIHGTAGVTFDLHALNDLYATKLNFFSADFGKMNGVGNVRGYVLFSDGLSVIGQYVTNVLPSSDSGFEQIRLDVPSNASYVTLMVGAGGDSITNDHGVFGDAALSTAAVPEPSSLVLIGMAGVSASFVRRRRTR